MTSSYAFSGYQLLAKGGYVGCSRNVRGSISWIKDNELVAMHVLGRGVALAIQKVFPKIGVSVGRSGLEVPLHAHIHLILSGESDSDFS